MYFHRGLDEFLSLLPRVHQTFTPTGSVSLRDDSKVQRRPLSAWQQLRGVGNADRSAKILQTFENKVEGAAEAMSDQKTGTVYDQPDEVFLRDGDWQGQQRPSFSREEQTTTTAATATTKATTISAEEKRSTNVPSLFSSANIDLHSRDFSLRQCVPFILTDRANSPLKPVTAATISTTPKATTKTKKQRSKNRPPVQRNDQFVGRMQRLNTAPRTVGHAWGGEGGYVPSLRTPEDADRPTDNHRNPLRPSSGQLLNAGQLPNASQLSSAGTLPDARQLPSAGTLPNPDQVPTASQSYHAGRLSTAGQLSATGKLPAPPSTADTTESSRENPCQQQVRPTRDTGGRNVSCSAGSRRRVLLLSSADPKPLLYVGSADRFRFRMSKC